MKVPDTSYWRDIVMIRKQSVVQGNFVPAFKKSPFKMTDRCFSTDFWLQHGNHCQLSNYLEIVFSRIFWKRKMWSREEKWTERQSEGRALHLCRLIPKLPALHETVWGHCARHGNCVFRARLRNATTQLAVAGALCQSRLKIICPSQGL